jgi:hypothetical protein
MVQETPPQIYVGEVPKKKAKVLLSRIKARPPVARYILGGTDV